MPVARILVGVLTALWLAGPAAYAQKGNGGSSTHGGGPKTTAGSHGGSQASGGPKTTTHGNPHTTTPKTHGNPHTTTATTTGSAKSRPTATTGTSAPTTTLNPIAQKLQGKPLGDRIQQMLGKNISLDAASAGFRNQGQFIAAVHVSQNLGIPFDQLKAAMLGTPATSTTLGTNPMSLGQAIQQLRPTVNSGFEVERAETQTDGDITATSTTSTKTTSKKQKRS